MFSAIFYRKHMFKLPPSSYENFISSALIKDRVLIKATTKIERETCLREWELSVIFIFNLILLKI